MKAYKQEIHVYFFLNKINIRSILLRAQCVMNILQKMDLMSTNGSVHRHTMDTRISKFKFFIQTLMIHR
jgi:hypothetical protein